MRALTKTFLRHVHSPCISYAVLSHPTVVSLQGVTRRPESWSLQHEVSCINRDRKPSLCQIDQHLRSSKRAWQVGLVHAHLILDTKWHVMLLQKLSMFVSMNQTFCKPWHLVKVFADASVPSP